MGTLVRNAVARCTCLIVSIVAVWVLVPPAWAGVGSGTLTVTNDGTCSGSGFNDFDSPNHWDVFQGQTIHINISPGFSICTAGDPSKINSRCSANADCNSTSGHCTGPSGSKTCSGGSPVNAGGACTTDSNCNIAGTCSSGVLECSGNTTVYVKGHDGTSCTSDDDCSGTNETECDTGIGVCKFVDPINTSGRVGSGDIDVCYTTPSDMCLGATVAYCNNVGLLANVNHPVGTTTFSAANLRAVDENDVPIEDCNPGLTVPDCTNEVGSFCCGLTQGAYGAPNSVATANCPGSPGSCPSTPATAGSNCGFIPAACSQGCDAFAGNPNATTIGIHDGTHKAVTVDNLNTLIAYLPAGGTPGQFKPSLVGSDTHYASPSAIPDRTTGGTASKGQGGGALSGQTMACELNDFLSACSPPFGGSGTFTASGFGGFTLPSTGTLVCTKRSGPDKVLGTDDDVCQAFSYPTCVAGKTVSDVLACANSLLATGSDSCGCTASELTMALDHINTQFDQCGNVIECPENQTAGVFTCPD